MDDLADRDRLLKGDEGWENAEGEEVQTVVFDKLSHATYKLFPIVEDLFTYEEAEQTPANDSFNAVHGIMSSIDGYTMSSPYGIIVGFDNDETNTFENTDPDITGPYGIVKAFQEDPIKITLYYIKRPDKILALTDELEVDELWDTGLEHYIAGRALRADKDTQNRSMGNEELQLYFDYVDEAKVEASNNFVNTKTQYNSPYVQGV